MKYSPAFLQLYDRVGTSVPLHRFADIVNPRAMGLESKEDFFSPVRFHVQVAPCRTRGSVALDVPVHGNENWYSDMQHLVAGMLGGKTEYSDSIRFKTVTGKDLADIDPRHFDRVGTLYMHINGLPKLLKQVNHNNVPVEYSVTKGSDLKNWYKELTKTLPDVVACELEKCKSAHELDDMICEGGPIQRMIENHLIKATFPQEWTEFVRTHKQKSPKTMSQDQAQHVLEKVSRCILGFIQAHMGASGDSIRSHLRRTGKSNKKAVVAVYHSSSNIGNEYTGPELYRRICDGAVITPALEKHVIRILHTESVPPIGDSIVPLRERKTYPIALEEKADHHPWNAHIHHMLKPLKGAYPSDYLARHVHQDMQENAYYPGQPIQAYQAYHLFKGYNGAPPGVAMKNGRPIGGALPELVEKRHSKGKRQRKGKKGKKGMYMKMREPISPKLENDQDMVPIQSIVAQETMIPIQSSVQEECPNVIPVSKGKHVEMETLIPIECHYKDKKNKKKDKDKKKSYMDVDSECPNVIPFSIGDQYDEEENQEDDEFAHLPQVADIFQ